MWQLSRNQMLRDHYRPIETGTVVRVERPWRQTWALLPHKTVRGQWRWMSRIYSRRVWIYTGFIDEPETQWGDLLDVLAQIDKHQE
jgi:hypothetical protein